MPPSPRIFYMRWDDLRPGPMRLALERILDPATAAAERVALARKVLSRGTPLAHCVLFDIYGCLCRDERFGAPNPLEEVLGILRVRALPVLRHPAGPGGVRHAVAARVLANAAKPKDIPLLLSLLDSPAHPDVPLTVYWALHRAVAALESPHPALIDAMERRLVPGHEDRFDLLEASRILADHRVPESEAALLRALPRLSPIDAIPVATALLSHDPVRHLDLARRVRDELPPREEHEHDAMTYARSLFEEALENAEHGGVVVMAGRARLAAVKASLADRPDQPLAPLLEGLDDGDHTALTPVLCRLLDRAHPPIARDILRALGRAPASTSTFFQAIEPWLTHPDIELRRLAMRAVLASRSDQARARLLSRLARSCATDAEDACALLSALAAKHPLTAREAAPALASPFPEVQALAKRLR